MINWLRRCHEEHGNPREVPLIEMVPRKQRRHDHRVQCTSLIIALGEDR